MEIDQIVSETESDVDFVQKLQEITAQICWNPDTMTTYLRKSFLVI
jgi:hypothetical protein